MKEYECDTIDELFYKILSLNYPRKTKVLSKDGMPIVLRIKRARKTVKVPSKPGYNVIKKGEEYIELS